MDILLRTVELFILCSCCLNIFAGVAYDNLLLLYTDIHSVCFFAKLGGHQFTLGVISDMHTLQLRYILSTSVH